MNQHNANGFFHEWNKQASERKTRKIEIEMSPTPFPPPVLPPPKPGLQPPKLPGMSEASEGFVTACRFEGARDGMVFKMGSAGLGYYPDHVPSSCSDVDSFSLVGVTIDHGRSVLRVPNIGSSNLTATIVGSSDRVPYTERRQGTTLQTVAPLNEPCSGRVATAFRWSAPRRGIRGEVSATRAASTS